MTRLLQLSIIGFALGLLSASANAAVVAYWRFEEGSAGSAASGSGALLDASGNGLNMTPIGGPIYQAVPNPGSTLGLDFDGGNKNALAYRPDSNLFKLTSLTVEAFIRFDGGSQLQQIFFRGDSKAGKDPFYLAVLNGKLRFLIDDSINALALTSPDPLPIGQYIHVAATLDDASNTMKIFVDGVEVGTQSAQGIRPNVSLYANARVSVGGLADGYNLGQYFNGVLDEVRISDTALSPSNFLGSAVPEPTTMTVWALLAVAGLAAVRRRNHLPQGKE